jgi:epoxyqueuosine reductase
MKLTAKSQGSLPDQIRQKAQGLGFHKVGFCALEIPEEAKQHYLNWLNLGHNASMQYLENRVEDRLIPQKLLPSAQSAIVLTISYEQALPQRQGTIARYALGQDYHEVIREQCERLIEQLQDVTQAEFKICVDSSPVLERVLAQQAGLGFIGKNGLLITEDGSFVFIAVILTSLVLTENLIPTPEALFSECGSCTACLEHCPTEALISPGVMNASRCISYWTIEHRGEIPDPLKLPIKDHLFGCDICQEVCPHNERELKSTVWPELKCSPMAQISLEEILSLRDDESFRAKFKTSAMRRTKREGLVRNACVVAGNLKMKQLIPYLELCLQDSSAVVQQSAFWALNQL